MSEQDAVWAAIRATAEQHNRNQELMQQLFTHSARQNEQIANLVKVFDGVVERGTPRCATQEVRITNLEENVKDRKGWLRSTLSGIIGAASGAIAAWFMKGA